jgi:hypothetical protein
LSSPDDADIILGTRIVPARRDRADDGGGIHTLRQSRIS